MKIQGLFGDVMDSLQSPQGLLGLGIMARSNQPLGQAVGGAMNDMHLYNQYRQQQDQQRQQQQWMQQNMPGVAGAPEWVQRAALSARGGGGSFGNTPLYFKDARGNLVMGRMAPGGGVHMPQLPHGLTPVKPYNYQDMGGYVAAFPHGSATPANAIQKTLKPGDLPSVKAAQARSVAQAQAGVKKEGAQSKRESNLSGQADKVEMIGGLINDVRGMAGFWTTGFMGNQISKVPGTPAHDMMRKLETIKANIGFDRLQEMRDNSPTGGALGQVSEFENRLLQAVWGNLEQSQTEEEFLKNLELVEQQVKASWLRVAQAYEQDYGKPYSGEMPSLDGGKDNDPLGIR